MRTIEKYSFGVGDRFAHQAESQLNAFVEAEKLGIDIVPVWNKSHREHTTIGSEPGSVRAAGDAAVKALGWSKSHYVDADHINLSTVDGFLDASDFFTIDVADSIGSAAPAEAVTAFVERHGELVGNHEIPGIDRELSISKADVEKIAAHYLLATIQAAEIFRHIESKKGDNFVTEVSMDETDDPQTPPEMLIILAAIARQWVRRVSACRQPARERDNLGIEKRRAAFQTARHGRDVDLGQQVVGQVTGKIRLHGAQL